MSRSNSRTLYASVFAALCAVTWTSAPQAAGDPREIPGYPIDVKAHDAREVALLPGYCKYTQTFRDNVPGGNNPAEIKRWYDIQGPVFHAMHHYCWGLMYMRRSTLVSNRQGREYYLNTAIAEFDYVIDRAPADFVLLPEIFWKKGDVLIRLGKGPAGAKALMQAIELKPDYWPPYISLGDYYRDAGNISGAREILKTGLSHSPKAKPLQRRLAELDAGRRGTQRKP